MQYLVDKAFLLQHVENRGLLERICNTLSAKYCTQLLRYAFMAGERARAERSGEPATCRNVKEAMGHSIAGSSNDRLIVCEDGCAESPIATQTGKLRARTIDKRVRFQPTRLPARVGGMVFVRSL